MVSDPNELALFELGIAPTICTELSVRCRKQFFVDNRAMFLLCSHIEFDGKWRALTSRATAAPVFECGCFVASFWGEGSFAAARAYSGTCADLSHYAQE